MADWQHEWTPDEIDLLVEGGIWTLEAWCALFEAVGEIRFAPRPYDQDREEHDA